MRQSGLMHLTHSALGLKELGRGRGYWRSETILIFKIFYLEGKKRHTALKVSLSSPIDVKLLSSFQMHSCFSPIFWPRASPRGPNSYYVRPVLPFYSFCLISSCFDIFNFFFGRIWTSWMYSDALGIFDGFSMYFFP